MPIKMIVGLGNPDEKYAMTRHNLGYRVIAELAKNPPAGVKLFEPSSYMNSSGISVSEMMRRNGYHPDEVLVVCDDFSIPLGSLRIRLGGSSGGHNGLDSIIESLGTQEIPRLRVGIGPVPPGQDPAKFVLGPFPGADMRIKVQFMIDAAAEAVRIAITDGFEIAMNRFNKISLP